MCTLLIGGLLLSLPQLSSAETDELLDHLENLELNIAEIEKRDGPFAEALFDPLMALAETELELGDPTAAKDTLQRAQNVAHRSKGVHTPLQLEAVDILTRIALDEGDYRSANQQQRFSFFVTTHHVSEDDPNIVNAYRDLADWYMQTGQTRRARNLLTEAIELAVNLEIDPLPLAVKYNQARRMEGLCCSAKDLVVALEDSKTSTSSDALAQAYIELGDTMILARREDEAARYFGQAHSLLPGGLNARPMPIPGRKTISRRTSTIKIDHMKFQRDALNPYRQGILEKMTEQQDIEDETDKPAWFILDPHKEHMGYAQPDAHEIADRDKSTLTLVGDPILFSEKQFDNLLSNRMKREKENYWIELSFTVKEDGDLDDIKVVQTTAPPKVGRLLVEALGKIYYRPAMEDGVPIAQEDVRLIQTFEPIERSI